MLLSSQSILSAQSPAAAGWSRGRLTFGGPGAVRGLSG
jgi:hypothetical protein